MKNSTRVIKARTSALTITANYRSGMIEEDQKLILSALDILKEKYELGDYFYELSDDTKLLHIHGTIVSFNNRVPYIKGLNFPKGINVNVQELISSIDIQQWQRYIRKSHYNIIDYYDACNRIL